MVHISQSCRASQNLKNSRRHSSLNVELPFRLEMHVLRSLSCLSLWRVYFRLNQRELCTLKSVPSKFHERLILIRKVYTSKGSIKVYKEENFSSIYIYIQCTHTCKDRTPFFFDGRGQAHRVGLRDCVSNPSSRRRQSQPLSTIPRSNTARIGQN